MTLDLQTIEVKSEMAHVFGSQELPRLTIMGKEGKPLVSISYEDGSLEYGEGYTPDEAAQAFWNAMAQSSPGSRAQAEVERLIALNAELIRLCKDVLSVEESRLDDDWDEFTWKVHVSMDAYISLREEIKDQEQGQA